MKHWQYLQSIIVYREQKDSNGACCSNAVALDISNMIDHRRAGSVENFGQYPLNLNRTDVDADDLHHYSRELERRSATLFVEGSSDCKLELWQAVKPKENNGKFSLSYRLRLLF